jgi:putative peptide zinc metalloprotease protein
MAENLFSPSWYRVAGLRPGIRRHVHFHRHHYRGQLWYVLQDPATGRCHRLSPVAHRLAGLMDGRRTTQEIWEAAMEQLGDDGPTQDETIRLLGLLHAADVLRCDVSPDTAELFRRSRRREQSEWWRRYLNPLALRQPLVDPAAFLDRWLHLVRPLFSPLGLAGWCAVIVSALVLAGGHWSDLRDGATAELLDPRNLVLLWILYPLVKGLHELGHAFATTVWGGAVHEMGVLFLVLVPIPYVDASAASAFPDKRRRMLVGAMGIMVELFVASLALFVWLSVEPGLIRSAAYDVMVISGVSSLLFNGNPLLRFDAYYVLADAIEIPNLGARSNQYIGNLVLKHFFGLEHVRGQALAPGEAPWLLFYGVASFIYRLMVLFAIALFVAGRFFFVGVLLAAGALALQLVVPAVRHVTFVLTSPRLAENRTRAVAASFGLAAGVAALLLLVPIPLSTRAQGVVWPPEGAEVRAGADGFVEELLVPPGSRVAAGQALIRARDPSLEAEVAVLAAQLRELRARRHAERVSDQVRADSTQAEIRATELALGDARRRADQTLLRASADGLFLVPRALDLVGRFLRQGQLVGHVVDSSVSTVRVVIPQADVARVRERTRGVEVRLAGRLGAVMPAQLIRLVPAATDRLPSAALGTAGGGRLPVDPADEEGLRTLDAVFQVDVTIPKGLAPRRIGERAYVRFEHGAEPVAWRAWSALRRLLLRQLGV